MTNILPHKSSTLLVESNLEQTFELLKQQIAPDSWQNFYPEPNNKYFKGKLKTNSFKLKQKDKTFFMPPILISGQLKEHNNKNQVHLTTRYPYQYWFSALAYPISIGITIFTIWDDPVQNQPMVAIIIIGLIYWAFVLVYSVFHFPVEANKAEEELKRILEATEQ